MKLSNKIEYQEKIIKEMNHVINSLVNTPTSNTITEQGLPGAIAQAIIKSPVGRYVLGKLGRSIFSDVKDEKVDTKDVDTKDVVTPEDIKGVVNGVLPDSSVDPSADELDQITHELSVLVDKQLALAKKYNKESFGSIIITFNAPIPFTIKRGEDKGTKLTLEKTKKYDIYNINKEKDKYNKKGYYKIYFTYKEWLKEYDIMFSLLQENIIKDVRKGDTVVYASLVATKEWRDNEEWNEAESFEM